MGVTPQQFAEHSRQLLSELGAQEGAQQHATPLDMPAITVEEVQHALQASFKGNVSSGLCALPSQLYKHMRGDSLVPLTALIN